MPKFVIEREIPGAGKLSAAELQAHFSKVMRGAAEDGAADPVARELRDRRQDLLRVYRPDEATVREHAKQGGFPANRVSKIARMIDPTTSES